jgi:very-short-patch-repair endonuclease
MKKISSFKIASARKLRAAMTDEERKLWQHLWRIPLEGSHFRRQVPIGPYCADFLSHRLKLVVEVDGFQHGLDNQRRHDLRRTAWLEGERYRVLRFWTHEIRTELDSVLDTVYAVVQAQKARHPTPDLRSDPPHRGEREAGSGISHLPLDGGGRSEAAGGGENLLPKKLFSWEMRPLCAGRSYHA